MLETLSPEDSKALLNLCRAGKLYEIEKWIAGGKSIRTPPQIKKTPLQVAMHLGLLERVLTYSGKPVTLEPSGRLSIEVWTEWGSNIRNW